MTQGIIMARHAREVFYGGNWTGVNLRNVLQGLSFETAMARMGDSNSIATLVYHISYYISIQLRVLKGEPLEGSDKDSFNIPHIGSQQDWEQLLDRVWQEADEYLALLGLLPDNRLSEIFVKEKYGSWQRNILGLIEHTHYHLGQIVLLKKWLEKKKG